MPHPQAAELEQLNNKLETFRKNNTPQGVMHWEVELAIASLIDQVGNLHGMMDMSQEDWDSMSKEDRAEIADSLPKDQIAAQMERCVNQCINVFQKCQCPFTIQMQVTDTVAQVKGLFNQALSEVESLLKNGPSEEAKSKNTP